MAGAPRPKYLKACRGAVTSSVTSICNMFPLPPTDRGNDKPPRGTTLILFARPHANFWVGSTLYGADEAGEVEVADESDAKDLIRAGCRPQR
jgi:hypothetical protein